MKPWDSLIFLHNDCIYFSNNICHFQYKDENGKAIPVLEFQCPMDWVNENYDLNDDSSELTMEEIKRVVASDSSFRVIPLSVNQEWGEVNFTGSFASNTIQFDGGLFTSDRRNILDLMQPYLENSIDLKIDQLTNGNSQVLTSPRLTPRSRKLRRIVFKSCQLGGMPSYETWTRGR